MIRAAPSRGIARAYQTSQRPSAHLPGSLLSPRLRICGRKAALSVRHDDAGRRRAWKLRGSLSHHNPTHKRPQFGAGTADLAPDTRKRPAAARIRPLLIRKRSQVRVLDRPLGRGQAGTRRPSSARVMVVDGRPRRAPPVKIPQLTPPPISCTSSAGLLEIGMARAAGHRRRMEASPRTRRLFKHLRRA